MTDYEFTNVMEQCGYTYSRLNEWVYKNNTNFSAIECRRGLVMVSLQVRFNFTENLYSATISTMEYKFENVLNMNSITLKKQLGEITEYAYSLDKDINRHIAGIAKKMEVKANKLKINC